MRVVFAGTPEVAAVSLRALLASEHEVTAVITRPPAPVGRGRALQPSPVAEVASAAGIEIITELAELDDVLIRYAPECCPIVAYGALIPASALTRPKYGWINVHFSLLPRWRGAAPVQWAIRSGDAETGVSVFQLEPGLDTGPILRTVTEPITSDDTAGSLLERLGAQGAVALVETLDDLAAGRATTRTQADHGITLAPKITVDDARIDWCASAIDIDRLIRSCTPDPGAWTMLGDRRIRIGPGKPNTEHTEPGVLTLDGRHLRVGTGDGSLVLDRVQPAGKAMMNAVDWWRGARLTPPVHFG